MERMRKVKTYEYVEWDRLLLPYRRETMNGDGDIGCRTTKGKGEGRLIPTKRHLDSSKGRRHDYKLPSSFLSRRRKTNLRHSSTTMDL